MHTSYVISVSVINVGCLKIYSACLLNKYLRQYISNTDLYLNKKANNIFLHKGHNFIFSQFDID